MRSIGALLSAAVLCAGIARAATVQIDACEDAGTWTPGGGASVTAEAALKVQGAGSIRVAISTGAIAFVPVQMTPAQASGWLAGGANNTQLSFWMRLAQNAAKADAFRFRVTLTGGEFGEWYFMYRGEPDTWQYYSFLLDSPEVSSDGWMTALSGGAAITSLEFASRSFESNSNYQFYIDDIRTYSGYSWTLVNTIEDTCSALEAQYGVAANRFVSRELAPWLDITGNITAADRARGFVETAISLESSDNNVRWSLGSDTDGGDTLDMRAFCDGVLYDINNERLKGFDPYADLLVYPVAARFIAQGAKVGHKCMIEYKVPRMISNFYKMYIGAAKMTPYGVGNSNWNATRYTGKVYVKSPVPGLYANIRITDVPVDARWTYDQLYKLFRYESDVYKVPKGQAIEFDGTESVVHGITGAINLYTWELIPPSGASTVKTGPKVTFTMPTAGTYRVALTVEASGAGTFPENPYARKVITVNAVEPPADVKLFQNGPNPFDLSVSNPVTRIKFSISDQSPVTVAIYTLTGKKLVTLLDEKELGSGTWEASWDGTVNGNKVNTGVYIYTLTASGKTLSKKMLVVR
jgi:hypothetical protein